MPEDVIYDLAIIGGGPIGIELAVALKRAGIDYVHFEAGQIGHTMMWWRRARVGSAQTSESRSPACR